jgi:two-component system, cell cycle sensor histidine kinase and response regulator CckA
MLPAAPCCTPLRGPTTRRGFQRPYIQSTCSERRQISMRDRSQPGSPPPSHRAVSRPIVLVVEDEDPLRFAIRRLLQNEGYSVLEAQNGACALELMTGAEAAGVNLVLTDLRMPVMDGRQLAAALARKCPSLPIIFMSGFTAQLMDMRLVSPHLPFLAKPFRNDELLATIRTHLGETI